MNPGSDRVKACKLAADALIKEHGSQSEAERKTLIKQQNLSNAAKGAIGIDVADEIAAAFDTTVDGLVRIFLKGGRGAVRAGDVPGWKRAVADAVERWGDQGYRYDLAELIELPLAPTRAKPDFARDLARLLHDHGAASHTRLKVQRS